MNYDAIIIGSCTGMVRTKSSLSTWKPFGLIARVGLSGPSRTEAEL